MNVVAERKFGVLLGYCAIVLRNVLTLVLIPFIIHHVGVSQYGLYSLVASLAGYLIILELGLANTTVRYLSKFKATDDVVEQSRFLGIILSIYAVITVVVTLVGLWLWQQIPQLFDQSLQADEIDLLQQCFIILLLNIVITLMSNSFTGVISAHERFTFQKSIEIIAFLLRCLAVMLALDAGFDILAIVVIDTAISLFHAVVRISYVWLKLKIGVVFHLPDKETLREIFLYTFFIALNVIVNQINWRVDNFIIASFTNSQAIGIFNIGNQLIFSFIAFASAVSNIFAPKLFKMVTLKASMSALTDELIHIGRLQMIVLGYILAIFVTLGPLFIQLFVGKDFSLAYWVAFIPMLPFTFVLAQTSTNAVLQAMNKHKVRSLLLLATALLNIIISVVLVKEIGMLGASIGTAVTLFFGELVLVNIYLSRVIGLEMLRFYRALLASSLPVVLITLACGFWLQQSIAPTWLALVLSCLLLLSIHGILVYLVTLTTVEKQQINSKCRQIVKRYSQ